MSLDRLEDPTMEGLIGKTLDNTYCIEQVLGRGSMGTVFRARDVNLDRDVAIKVMHAHFADDEGFRARFLQEARAVATLDHPGIVQVHTFGQDMGLLYIVMDFTPGQTLQAWLKRLAEERKIVALAESLRIVHRIAEAVHYAHIEGVLHGNIKPANIMLKLTDPAMQEMEDLPFHPVLTDFGLARLAKGSVQIETGMTIGTPAYMSPEQCLGYEPDRRSDIYSLGIVLYELVTGRVPFEVKSLTEATGMHIQEPPPSPRSINPALPIEVENTLLCALAKREDKRYATAREMAHALQATILDIPSEVSLMTRLAQESAALAAPGSEVWEAATPPSQVGATVIIVAIGGETRRISLGGPRTLMVGRTSDNDIQLADSSVSRNHVQIAYDGQSFSLTDMNSANGTFLGDWRLPPGVRQPWPLGMALRFGTYWAKYEVQAAAKPSITAPSVPPLAAAWRTVLLEPDTLIVEAGQQAAVRLRILNQGTQIDHFAISIDGIPESWVTLPKALLRLNPNEEGLLTLTLHPPRDPQSTAGEHPFSLRVVPQANPGQRFESLGTLNVIPFYEIGAELRPQQISTDRACLELANRGNAPTTLSISGTDPAEALLIHAQPAQLALQPGEQQTVFLEVRTRKRRPLLGRVQYYPFDLSICSSVGQSPKCDGTRIVRPIVHL